MPRIRYVSKQFGPDRLKLIEKANEIIKEYTEDGFNLTLRQLYYQFVSRDIIPNNQKSYSRLGDVINDARLAGLIDWNAISDRLRELRRLSEWRSLTEIIETCAETFRIDLWKDQKYRPEVWVEKDALAEVVEMAAFELRVPVMVCRGYMSQSAVWDAGAVRFRRWIDRGQKPVVIHLGDHDPSGIDMTRDIGDRLSMFALGRVEVERIALNMDQVKKYKPPSNPAKITDSRAQGYIALHGNKSWELDALEPRQLTKLIQDAIYGYLQDRPAYEKRKQEEQEHRDNLKKIADNYDDVVDNL